MATALPTHRPRRSLQSVGPAALGVGLCLAITATAYVLQAVADSVVGRPTLEALVLAILVGAAVRSMWCPPAAWNPGIDVSGKLLLEVAIVLLGLSVSLQAVTAAGPWLLLGIGAVVATSLVVTYAVGRLLGVPTRTAVLIACGNSICGNSAIAAVAPVIGARADEVASSIAFTAILGVIVVLGLPLLVPFLVLGDYGYGVLAGLTVYAVPQVLAATVPISLLSAQVGTLVKLVRVLTLGPVIVALSLTVGRGMAASSRHLPLSRLVPWFIVGFVAMTAVGSTGAVPDDVRVAVARIASLLTVVSMAALGLGVDARVLRTVGIRAVATVAASLLLLIGISLALIRVLGVE